MNAAILCFLCSATNLICSACVDAIGLGYQIKQQKLVIINTYLHLAY